MSWRGPRTSHARKRPAQQTPLTCGPGLKPARYFREPGNPNSSLSETNPGGWEEHWICVHDNPPGGEVGPATPVGGAPAAQQGPVEISRVRSGPEPLPGIGLNAIAQMVAFQRLAREVGGNPLEKFFQGLAPTSGRFLDRPGADSDLLALPGAQTDLGITTGGFAFGDVPAALRNFGKTIFNTLPGGTLFRALKKKGWGPGTAAPPAPPSGPGPVQGPGGRPERHLPI